MDCLVNEKNAEFNKKQTNDLKSILNLVIETKYIK